MATCAFGTHVWALSLLLPSQVAKQFDIGAGGKTKFWYRGMKLDGQWENDKDLERCKYIGQKMGKWQSFGHRRRTSTL